MRISEDQSRRDRRLEFLSASLVASLDVAALCILSLVPLAAFTGWADVVVPASAVMGWLLLAVPLFVSAAVVIGHAANIDWLLSPTLAQTAFGLSSLACILAAAMAVQAEFAEGDSVAMMRGFATTASSLFAMNLVLLWRRAFEPDSRD